MMARGNNLDDDDDGDGILDSEDPDDDGDNIPIAKTPITPRPQSAPSGERPG